MASPASRLSRFGLGTFRMVAGNQSHEAAAHEALRAGARVIDTAPNYGDGAAELLAGAAVRRAVEQGVLADRSEVALVSKGGYVQGAVLAAHRATPYPDADEYSDECEHCKPPIITPSRTRRRAGLQQREVAAPHTLASAAARARPLAQAQACTRAS